eukprot:3117049-Rhodomonas_salina.1
MIDDFREAYWWLRDNTPVLMQRMSYQRTRVCSRGGTTVLRRGNGATRSTASRTVLPSLMPLISGYAMPSTDVAYGSARNHEHIALLGKSLVSPTGQRPLLHVHLGLVGLPAVRVSSAPGDCVSVSLMRATLSVLLDGICLVLFSQCLLRPRSPPSIRATSTDPDMDLSTRTNRRGASDRQAPSGLCACMEHALRRYPHPPSALRCSAGLGLSL